MSEQVIEGRVKFWKGTWGMITPDGVDPDADDDCHVHQTELRMDGYRKLDAGQRVRFTVEETDRGRAARSVEVIGND